VAFSKLTLKEITNKIGDGVEARAEQGLYTYRIICAYLNISKYW